MRWLGYVATILWWSGIARSLSTLNRGHSYKISPKPCKGPEPGGDEGTCMFVWECIKSEGNHVGVCVDTFMFGSCCVHNATTNNVNADPGFAGSPPPRPSLAEALSAAPTRPTSPSSPYLHQQSQSTTSLPRPQNVASASSGSAQGAQRPNSQRPRPAQKRPYAKPNANQDNRLDPTAQGSRPQGVRNPSLSNGLPTVSGSLLVTQADDSKTKTQSPGHSMQHEATGPSDKVDNSHNTLIVKLPSRVPSLPARPHRPGYDQKPSTAQRPSESRPDDGKTGDADLVVQATMHRPSVDLANEDDTEVGVQLHSPNYIHTERPQWATKPAASHKPSTDYSKPHFSVKTSTYRPGTYISHQSQPSDRPNFVSKPQFDRIPGKPTSTVRPTYYSSQMTGTAGLTQPSVHWQVTTEPAFITKHKPATSRPPTILEAARPTASSPQIWSENSWTPPQPSLKPHWTDDPSWLSNGPHSFPSKPAGSQRPTRPTSPNKPYESSVYEKPMGAAHYITTSYVETSTKSKPTKKTNASTTPTSTSTTSSTTTSTTTTTTTEKPATTVSYSSAPTLTTKRIPGTVMTVSAISDNKETQCGVPPLFPRPETRIVGGKDAPFGRWPWQVSVRRTSFFGFSSTHRCGGAVLNENWIATAGHCVDDLLTSQIRIRVGEYDFSSVQERLPFVERAVARKVVHPKYNFFTYEYDLALVRLETSLTFAPHISPICLPASDDLLIGENATVTGWGRLSEGGTLPSVLQEVSVPIVSNDKCKSMFLRAGRHEFIPDIFLCAGHETGGQDSCQGDSGGPLQVRGKDGRYFLAGIISWGIGCAEANLPGVCTRISKFVPWILKNVT
ncbi:serine proteinase stubble-like [Neodiprion virginianus]|uniref:serine proteinase stubble-like n=1 Tax=Neodiprion virginianus TaxID=2961670 RepID=UPI001EE75C80|nr:serine proteinase stubble-like [Neodiprion virginianus]XP_046624540.1 serine proteinase stubble-like [Neodiprion virginianus]